MRGRTVNYVDFSGGLNTQAAPFALEQAQVRDALNVHVSPTGTVRKRHGFTTLSATAGIVNSLAPANTTAKSLIAATGTELYKVQENGTVTSIASGLTSDARWEWVQAQFGAGPVGPMYGINGFDTPQRWDGAAGSTSDWVATTGTVPATTTIMKFHGSRIWMAGDGSSRLYFSGITGTAVDTLNWDGDNFVDLEPEDGDAITALGSSGPNLLVFKARKTFVVYDLFTGANRKLSDEIGCIAPRSVVETPAGTFFLSETDGVLATDGSKIRRVSDNVITSFTSAAASQPTLAQAAAVYSGSSYFLSIASGLVVNDVTYEYDLQTQSWWRHSCAANQWALVDPVGSPVLYTANPAGATVQKAFVGGTFTDVDDVYDGGAYFTTAYFVWGEPSLMKHVPQVRTEGIGTWEGQYATNFRDDFATMDGELWDSTEVDPGTFGGGPGTFGGAGTFGPTTNAVSSYRYYTLERSRAFSFKFLNADAADFQIYEVTASVNSARD